METGQKKKRSPNFTSHEKNVLINIIANSFANIIENKKTNQVSITQKLNTWKQIENEFNLASTTGIFRSWESLKLFYENQKKEMRKKKAEEKRETFKTGGGPPATTVVNSEDTDEVLASIVGDKTISGHHNPFDCDALYEDSYNERSQSMTNLTFEFDPISEEDLSKLKRENKNTHMPVPVNLSGSMGFEVEDIQNDSQNENNTENRKRPPSPISNKTQFSTPAKRPCNPQRRRPMKTIQNLTSSKFAEKYDLLLDKRLTLVEKQIEAIDNDSRMKKEKHVLELGLLKLEIKKKQL